MADIADEGNEITQLATDRSIANIQNKLATEARIQSTGYCLNPKCAEDLDEGRLFCDSHCATEYEVYKKC